jgi:transposase
MGKKGSQRRVYTKEFKAEAVALAEKREKSVGQVAKDLGLNESMLRRWMVEAQGAVSTGVPAFPGNGRPRSL